MLKFNCSGVICGFFVKVTLPPASSASHFPSEVQGSSDFEAVDWRTLLRALARSGSSKAQQLHPNDLTSIAWAFVDATPLQMHWLQRGAMSGMEKMKPSGVPMKYEPLD
jgi:hypothetical protein